MLIIQSVIIGSNFKQFSVFFCYQLFLLILFIVINKAKRIPKEGIKIEALLAQRFYRYRLLLRRFIALHYVFVQLLSG